MTTTKTIHLNLEVEKPFGNLFRKNCVLIVVFDHENNVLLGDKPYFYPPTITRLLGGGVGNDEDPRNAACRELKEEINVDIPPENFKETAVFHTKAIDADGNKYENTTHLFSVSIGAKKYSAGDDVKTISRFSRPALQELVKRYENLPKTLWHKGPEGEFSWYDYAQLYGAIHKEVEQEWRAIETS